MTSRTFRARWFIFGLGVIAGFDPTATAQGPGDLTAARVLRQTGKTAEAEEIYEKLAADPKSDKLGIALGLADCLETRGKPEEAIATLEKVAASNPAAGDKNQAAVFAKLSDLRFNRGEWTSAAADASKSLKADPDNLLARWTEARLLEAQGKRAEAVKAWKAFIDFHNAREPEVSKNSDALIIIGQAAEKYYRAIARGEELGESLNDVITGLYEAALKVDPNCWRAAWLEGRLFLSGYQEGDARKELTRALEINPLAAEAIVTLGQVDLNGYKLAAGRRKAERALEINPRLASAYILVADLNISDERFADARTAARKAVKENPRDEAALARLAASARLLTDRTTALAAESVATANNPRPAEFYSALGERLSDRRKYQAAERAYLLAIKADPDRADVRIGLGRLYMQTGRETEAKDLFAKAFEADPFNVRASNMMKVLDHMASYRAVGSEHFEVIHEPNQDALISKYISKYLESIYKELTDKFGYEPPGLTKIEILKDHQRFSGRTIELPFIPTVGACTGKVVALASPRATNKPFHWARVLKHELVHVITLRQTNFNIPHWFTEALAVESEGFPRPQPWNKMLQERVPARKLLNLDTINLGFIRPNEPEDRQMAYCQAQLYAQYMLKRFGADALAKMLDAYRRGMTTEQAIKMCFNVEKADFETKYLSFLDDVLKTIRTRVNEEPKVEFSRLRSRLAEKPDDPDLNATMAYEFLARRDYKSARPLADKALKVAPKHPLAGYVKARLFTVIGDEESALGVLELALDEAKPNERVVDLLAELKMKAGKLDEAEKLYELARKDDPYHSKWIAGLARVHLRQDNQEKLLGDLEKLADNDSDDLDVRKTLAKRYLERKNPEKAEHWARESLYIDVYDPEPHTVLADALAAQNKHAAAIAEYEAALSLKPKQADLIRVRLARSQADSGDLASAKATLDEILKRDPGQPEAKELRATLK